MADMTREEAIEIFEEMLKAKEKLNKCGIKNEYRFIVGDFFYEALNMAIDSLRIDRLYLLINERSEEDCISRQAVLEAFNLSEKTHKYGGDHSGYDTMMLYEIQDVIEDLPSVQPKPMQVELEGDGYANGKLVYDYGKCPKCGWQFEYGEKDWEEPYCCHCGQKLHWFESEE